MARARVGNYLEVALAGWRMLRLGPNELTVHEKGPGALLLDTRRVFGWLAPRPGWGGVPGSLNTRQTKDPVRAGMVEDPALYRFALGTDGHAEARSSALSLSTVTDRR